MEEDAESGVEQVDADPGLIFEKIDAWVDGFFRLLPNLVVALVVLAIVVAIGLAVQWGARRSLRGRQREDLGAVMGSLVKWAIWISGGMLALTIVVPSIRPGDLIAGLGIGSVAIGFAFKDILQNMLAGILILIRQPFEVGDQIVAGPYEGTVEHIQTRATLIRTYDGRRVVIPNSDVYTDAVTVNTAFGARRSQADFPIALSDDWPRGVEVALDAARSVDGVVSDPSPDAQALEIGDLSKVIRVRWWTDPTQAEVVHTGSRVRLAVEGALRDAGFTIPRRTDLHLDGLPKDP
ncbi:mechanosensitive ion channel family protein [Jannaschia sp. S6380]|uniref:mechanosensitive ion channel family protein n=1 Tax=Jannaschia sp. S6380 TaxID=2926408 RepID=UPI001FF23CF1|nr:mechanosensitive ion channel family protein [Jannaschia sp. S6380]MCK0167134.1 mechanosensitive ion channel family protein [Jannaschia sp. S6380]